MMNNNMEAMIKGITNITDLQDITMLEHLLFAQKTLLEERKVFEDRLIDLKDECFDIFCTVDEYLTDVQAMLYSEFTNDLENAYDKAMEESDVDKAESMLDKMRDVLNSIELIEEHEMPRLNLLKSVEMLREMNVDEDLDYIESCINRGMLGWSAIQLNKIQKKLFGFND